ncbi:MAG: hexose kinase [Gemmatimonadetes bacterium]|nr:hexose kinase [Gemmatimonadota bacterium]
MRPPHASPGAPPPGGCAQPQKHSRAGPLVLTVTPNPSIDLLFEAERLVWEDANRTASPRRRVGGQGINVVRALRALGGEGVSLALLGGPAGADVQALLEAEGHPLIRVEAEGDTRVFVAAREHATGRSLLLNPRGPVSTCRSGDAPVAAAAAAIAELQPRWVACGGSVPPGIPADTYARIGTIARASGARFVPDCDGELLGRAAAAGCELLVPNQHEAERLSGSAIASVADAVRVAGRLRTGSVDVVCITLGAQGAVIASRDGAWHAATHAEDRGSAVGAGDAFLAAVLWALDRGDAPPEVVRQGVAAGAAALRSEGEDLLTGAEFERQLRRTVVQVQGEVR